VLRELRATIVAGLPRVRVEPRGSPDIEDLLQDIDEWCGFTRAFQSLGGYQPRGTDPHRSLLATLIAHGTNLRPCRHEPQHRQPHRQRPAGH